MTDSYATQLAQVALRARNEAEPHPVLDQILALGSQLVGADCAGLVLVHDDTREVEATAATEPISEKAIQLQLEIGEGPCQSILAGDTVSVLIADALTDPRWPTWGSGVAELGLRSVLCIQLSSACETGGAVSFYSETPDRFGSDAVDAAGVFAAQASVALASAHNARALWGAIEARHRVGQAQGILMERFGIDQEQAFAVLRRYSQHNNVKLRDVAATVAATGRLPGDIAVPGAARRPSSPA